MKYNSDSIKSLGIIGGVRAKPASVGIESHNHTFIEILGNSIDEARAGYGHEIIVTKHENGRVSIRDFGRGVPMEQNSQGEWAYQKVFNELWSGGKYENNSDKPSSYNFSLGTNGIGCSAVNYLSDSFEVTSYREDLAYYVHFEKGVEQTNGLLTLEMVEPVGTLITWTPSKECFRGKGEIDNEFIIQVLSDQAIVNGGLKFTFINEQTGDTSVYHYEEGIVGYLKEIAPKSTFIEPIAWSWEHKGSDNAHDIPYQVKAEVYFTMNRELGYQRFYHATSYLENGGTPEELIKSSFTYAIDKYIKDNNLYVKKEKKITFEDIIDSLHVITSTYATISLFTDQTKKKIQSDFLKIEGTKWLREQLAIYFIENPNEAKQIANQVLINKRSREKAEKTRLDTKKKLTSSVNNLTNKVDGFVDCRLKENDKRELYIVEGKSALGSTVQGRDPNTQAIYAIRGKILNCLKAEDDKIFKNDIIVDLLKIFGCGVERKSKHTKDLPPFSIENLRFNKVIIATDSDVDGYHIRTLVLTMIYRLVPSLIKEGKVFIVESPLFEVMDTEDNSHFAFNDQEKEQLIQSLGKKVTLVQRSKGLGENTAEMMWTTTLNPQTRKLIQIQEDKVLEEMNRTFELFLGEDLANRKAYIEENLHHYLKGEENE